MPSAKSHLFSVLTRQHLLLRDGFAARYPHAWLVWEAGLWTPPVDEGGKAQTQLPDHGPQGPRRGDALCFELIAEPGERMGVGRAPENEVVLNDATVSRHQLVLERAGPDRWTAAAVPESSPTQVLGAALPQQGVRLSPGLMLHLGDVSLSFHTCDSFCALVAASAAKLA
jgi:hypothetical protein